MLIILFFCLYASFSFDDREGFRTRDGARFSFVIPRGRVEECGKRFSVMD